MSSAIPLLDEILAQWFAHGVDEISARLSGGDRNDVRRVVKDGRAYALRVYPPATTRAMVREEQAVVMRLAQRLRQVPAPIPTITGEHCTEISGRVATLMPYTEGRSGKNSDGVAAAALLAEVHQASIELELRQPRSACAALAELDWHANRWWQWPRVQALIEAASMRDTGGIDPQWMLERMTASFEKVLPLIDALRASDLPILQVHGDYYLGNLKVSDGRIVALLDWDETRPEWRAWEVGRSIWEFCEQPRTVLDQDAARCFLEAYRQAGGTILPNETEMLVPMMRVNLAWGLLYDFGDEQQAINTERGLSMDWQYAAHQVEALDKLRDA